jgi:uncharacterized membrane protein
MLDSPLHPLLVHFPIALLIIGFIALIVSYWKPRFYKLFAFILFGLGWASGILAYMTGDDAREFARRNWGIDIHHVVHLHETYAMWTLIVFAIVLVLMVAEYLSPTVLFKTLTLICAVIGIILLFMTGHYGGKMVYDMPHHSGTHISHVHGDDD